MSDTSNSGPPNGVPHAGGGASHSTSNLSPEDRDIIQREEATAARVGSAATCQSDASNRATQEGYTPMLPVLTPSSHGSPMSPLREPIGLPPRAPGSVTSSPAGSTPRACMPPPGWTRRASVMSVEEDGTGLDYPIGEEELAELRQKRTQRHPSYAHIFPQDKWPGYRPIEEHGLIGNMHTCAVISTDAQVSWYW